MTFASDSGSGRLADRPGALFSALRPGNVGGATAKAERADRQRRSNGDVRLGRHASRPGREVRGGRRHADLRGADGRRRRPATTAWSRRSRPIPASAGTRWRPGRIRPSMARRTTPSSALVTRSTTGRRSPAPACCRRTRSPTPLNARARRSPRSIGWAVPPPTSRARPSTSRTSSRTAASWSVPRIRSSRTARRSSA